jgi:ParB family chromosome partitioning protein
MFQQDIDIDSILFDPLVRKADPGVVAGLATSIKLIGLLHPIVVKDDAEGYRLIAGRNRLEACRSLDWKTIPANIADDADLDMELVEIDENLFRKELTALERSQLEGRRKQIFFARYADLSDETTPPAESSQNTEKDVTTDTESTSHSLASATNSGPTIGRFEQETAKATGESVRTVRQNVAIGEKLSPVVAEMIRDLPIADNKSELWKLAKLPSKSQEAVAESLKQGWADSVDDAIESLGMANERPPKPAKGKGLGRGRPRLTEKGKVAKILGQLIRGLDSLKLYKKHEAPLTAIAKDLED